MSITTDLPVHPLLEITALDRAFGRYVARGAPEHVAMLVEHSAVLVSAERAQGNSCVELLAYAGRPIADGPPGALFPEITTWCDALVSSGQCVAVQQSESPTLDVTPLVLHGTRLYLRRFFEAEGRVAAAIRERVASPRVETLAQSAPLFRTLFPAAAKGVDWQAVAAVAALRSSLVFVTGGPGTGKTTVAARLLALLLDRDPTLSIAVAAPTGRAAARLTEAIGSAVQREQLQEIVGTQLPTAGNTLHRLLGYTPWNEQFRHHRGNPLPYDVLIVDEASMVDVLMMDALFAAARPAARIIVLGDSDQLASVDTGFVLGDVARAARVAGGAFPEAHSQALGADYATLSGGSVTLPDTQPFTPPLRDAVVRLRVSYRFGSRPGIGALATATQEGDAAAVLRETAYHDIALDAPSSIEGLLAPLMPQIEAYLNATSPQEALAALARFRVLCALRDGDTGVSGVNDAMERWLLRRGIPVTGWYHHRPILISANDPALRLFNGDVGTTWVADGVPMVYFPVSGGGVRAVPPSRLPSCETAWAMTVHKSQGSEFDHVRLVLPETDTRILTRELLYTGITRARERVSIVATPEMVRLATQRSVARSSGLVERLHAP
jgi:exodeoxyribonuclease V alpha subunit